MADTPPSHAIAVSARGQDERGLPNALGAPNAHDTKDAHPTKTSCNPLDTNSREEAHDMEEIEQKEVTHCVLDTVSPRVEQTCRGITDSKIA